MAGVGVSLLDWWMWVDDLGTIYYATKLGDRELKFPPVCSAASRGGFCRLIMVTLVGRSDGLEGGWRDR